eukprot:363446-Chlamydomonas_euryale.AAC.14
MLFSEQCPRTLHALGTRGSRRRYDDTASNQNAGRLIDRLDALMTVMAYCKGPSCRNPWRVLHPDGSVNYLLEAMSPVFDSFYRCVCACVGDEGRGSALLCPCCVFGADPMYVGGGG